MDEEEQSTSSSVFPLVPQENNSSIRHCYGSPSIGKIRSRNSNAGNNNSTRRNTISKSLRWNANIVALLSSFFFSGIIFGWAPLKLILLREGQYENECNNNNNQIPCSIQMDHFNYIFTISQFLLSFASLPVGFFLDHASKTLHYSVAAVLEVCGLILFAYSDTTEQKNFDHFALSYSLLAFGGCMTILGAFPASFLLPNHQAGILAGISCLFDASSIIFAIFYKLNLYNDEMFSRLHMFTVYAILGVLVYGSLAISWAKLEHLDWKSIITTESNSSSNEQQQNGNNNNNNTDNGGNNNSEDNNSNDAHTRRIRKLNMHQRTILQQLVTVDFLLVLIFASIHMLRCNFYIETVNEVLVSLGDNDSTYATIFSFVLPAGIIFVPLIEATVRKYGVINTLHVTNILGIVFGILLLIPSLYIQTINFLLFACFRAYLYATMSTYIAITFGVNTMGRIIGCTFTTAAIITLLQYPAASIAENQHNNDFTIINTVMLLICIVPITLTWFYSNNKLETIPEEAIQQTNGEKQPLLQKVN